MPGQAQAKKLAKKLLADRKLKKARPKLEEDLQAKFSGKQIGILDALQKKGVPVSRCYDDYRAIAGQPGAFELIAQHSAELQGMGGWAPQALATSVKNLLDLGGYPECAKNLESILEIDAKALRSFNYVRGGVKGGQDDEEEEDDEVFILENDWKKYKPKKKSKSREQTFKTAAGSMLRDLHSSFQDAESLGILGTIMDLGNEFYEKAAIHVLKQMGPCLEPLRLYVKYAVKSIGILRRAKKKRHEKYFFEWLRGIMDSHGLREYAEWTSRQGCKLLNDTAEEKGANTFKWWAEQILEGPEVEGIDNGRWIHMATWAVEKNENGASVPAAHRSKVMDLAKNVLENYKRTSPSEKHIDEKATRTTKMVVGRSLGYGIGGRIIDLGLKFHSRLSDEALLREESGKEPVTRYMGFAVDIIELIRHLRPAEEMDAAKDYFFKLFDDITKGPLKHVAVDMIADAKSYVSVVSKEAGIPNRKTQENWYKSFDDWYELVKRVARKQKDSEGLAAAVKSITKPYLNLHSNIRKMVMELAQKTSYAQIEGAEGDFIKAFSDYSQAIPADEIKKLWDFSCKIPVYEEDPEKDPASKQRCKHFSRLLRLYSGLAPAQRGFAVEKAEEFLKKTSDIYYSVGGTGSSEGANKGMIEDYVLALNAFFAKVPQLFKVGSKAASQWIDDVRKGATLNPKGYSSRRHVVIDDASRTLSVLASAIRKEDPAESVYRVEMGVNLVDVKAVLLEYAHAFSKKPLKIEPTQAGYPVVEATNGEILFLPSRVDFFEEDNDNFKFYKVLTSYQCGMIEFGTFECRPEKVAEKIPEIKIKGRYSIQNILDDFPNSAIAADMFYIAEIARVGSRLRETYPGLVSHMDAANEIFLTKRPALASMHDAPKILAESLYRYAITGKPGIKIPKKEQQAVFKKMAAEIDKLRDTSSTVEDSMAAAYRICIEMPEISEERERLVDLVEKSSEHLKKARIKQPDEAAPKPEDDELTRAGRKFKYDEWNFETQSYRRRHVTVFELDIPPKQRGFIEQFHADNAGQAEKVKKLFQRLKRKEIQVVKRRTSGRPEYRLAVKAAAAMNAGRTPSPNVFKRTYKNRRSVVGAWLADISGSAGNFVGDNGNLRPLDLIREAALYYSIGLDAIKDPFAIFAYSGEGKDNVKFYRVKDFNESFGPQIEDRVGDLRPQENNRDGAGIRHATELLLRQPYRTKILLYITDFTPQDITPKDSKYEGEYAMWDTRVALGEAAKRGVFPCVIIACNDLKGTQYNPEIMRGIRHVVVDNLAMLPTTVPDVYRKLTTR